MNTPISIFRRLAGRLVTFNTAQQAEPDSVLRNVTARARRPARPAGAAAKGKRMSMAWQLHGETPQTPSNLM